MLLLLQDTSEEFEALNRHVVAVPTDIRRMHGRRQQQQQHCLEERGGWFLGSYLMLHNDSLGFRKAFFGLPILLFPFSFPCYMI